MRYAWLRKLLLNMYTKYTLIPFTCLKSIKFKMRNFNSNFVFSNTYMPVHVSRALPATFPI